MNEEVVRASPWFEALLKDTHESLIRLMSTTKGAPESSTPPVGDAPEIRKSPRMLRPKKDLQVAGPIRMSPRNPWFGKLSMEEKGKIVNVESDDEEEDPPTFVEEMEPEEEADEDIQIVCATTKLPKYVPPWKGRVKVPKDLDTISNTFNTPSLPEGVLFEGMDVGGIPSMKFEDWDLVDSEKFPHLETSKLMEQSTEGVVTTLQPWTWLCGVEEAMLLHLLSIPHFHRAPITIFVIR